VRIRKIVSAAVAVLVGLPLTVALVLIVTISVLDRTSGSIVSSGETREYLIHVPDSYDPATPAPLVLSMHAGGTWPAHQMKVSRWNRLADEHGFIVAYPSGNPQIFGVARIWHTFAPGAGLERDVRFISELIDTLRAAYSIDPARIYANGLSNGGGLAFALSCALPDRIAAVGMVAPAQTLPPGWCGGGRPVPMIVFHGDADPVLPYDGGPLGDPFNPVKPVFTGIREVVASWADRNGCAVDPVRSTIAPDVTRLEYQECAEGAVVMLHTIAGGGHTWPGGKPMPRWRVGPTSQSIDATSEMWAFFTAHASGLGSIR
jgi:polyhydroxybutyrate depolymerase